MQDEVLSFHVREVSLVEIMRLTAERISSERVFIAKHMPTDLFRFLILAVLHDEIDVRNDRLQ